MNVFGHPYFLQFCVPLIAVSASVFLKYVTRNDAHKSFRKEDLAVGLDISITALIIFITAGATLRLDAPADGLPWLRLLTFVSSPGALVGGRLLFLDAVDVVDEGDDDDCANHHDMAWRPKGPPVNFHSALGQFLFRTDARPRSSHKAPTEPSLN